MVEHIHGKDEVSGSIPDLGSRRCNFWLSGRVIIDEGVEIINQVEKRTRCASLPYHLNTTQALSDVQILKDSRNYPWMFGMLVDRYQAAFLRKASYLLRSHDAAEDAVQDTFLKIYKNAHKFTERRGASFNSWAYKILTNTCYSYVSRQVLRAGRVKTVDFNELDVSGDVDDSRTKEQVSLVRSVLVRLPTNLSRLLSLYFFEEKSYEEIANIEHLSLSAVRSGLHRAKKQFKNMAIKMV